MSDTDSESGVSNIRQLPDNYDNMPSYILQYMYQYLPLSDLCKTQGVCKNWKEATKTSFAWKNSPLIIKQYAIEDAANQMASVPFLHSVKSRAQCGDCVFLVDSIVNYLLDLRDMNVRFVPPISSSQVRKLVKKFSMLESITLNISAEDVIQSLEILRNSLNLREIKYFFHEVQPTYLERVSLICRTMAVGFPRLRKLNICYFQITGADNDILDLLNRKMPQLKYLKLTCHDSVHPDILNAVFRASKLEELRIRLWNQPIIPIHTHEMRSLRCLEIKTIGSDCHHVTGCRCHAIRDTITELTIPSGLEKLIISLDKFRNFRCGILEKAIITSKNLNHLQVSNISDPDIHNQLADIKSLRNLRTLVLEKCKNVRAETLEYVSQCQNLQNLVLTDIALTNVAFEHLKNCAYLKIIVLRRCDLQVKKLLPLILSLKCLTDLYVCGCYDRSRSQIYFIDDRILQVIAEECKNQNRSVHITWNVPPKYKSIF